MPLPESPLIPAGDLYPEFPSLGAPPRLAGVRIGAETPAGVGYDLTERVEGASWSSVNPGGDEVANFTIHAAWRAANPEIARGNLVRITHGLEVLWQGRIEERDRSAGSSEQIAVTAYGLGARLKDGTMRENYVDRSAGSWASPTLNMRVAIGASVPLETDYSASADQQSLAFDGQTGKQIESGSEAILVYQPPEGLAASEFQYRGVRANYASVEAPTLFASDDDTTDVGTWNGYALTLDDTLRSTSLVFGAKAFLVLRMRSTGSHTPSSGQPETFTYKLFAVYGTHGLARKDNGTEPDGFTADQVVADAVGRAEGVVVRRIDPKTYIIDDLVFAAPTAHEGVVSAADAFEVSDWGTWGPTSVFDRSTDGYFDYKNRDRSTAHWFCRRAETADLELADELAGAFDTVEVSFTDETGTAQLVTASVTVPELADEGLSPRILPVDGGELTTAGATQLAEVLLALQGGFIPARGSTSLEGTITHYQRGRIPVTYLRADGSNIRIPDVLPTASLFELSDDPDRRTTFPIKRVTVDVSGKIPRAQLELDQTFDALSLIQARLGLARDYAPTALIGGGGGPGGSSGGGGGGGGGGFNPGPGFGRRLRRRHW